MYSLITPKNAYLSPNDTSPSIHRRWLAGGDQRGRSVPSELLNWMHSDRTSCLSLSQKRWGSNRENMRNISDFWGISGNIRHSQHCFWKFCSRKCQKYLKSCIKYVQTRKKKHVIITRKKYDFSSSGVNISRFWANSEKFCTLARLHDRYI